MVSFNFVSDMNRQLADNYKTGDGICILKRAHAYMGHTGYTPFWRPMVNIPTIQG